MDEELPDTMDNVLPDNIDELVATNLMSKLQYTATLKPLIAQEPQVITVTIPGMEYNPLFIQAQEEAAKKVQYTTVIVTDTDNPNVGRAIYDPELSQLTLYMHDGYIPQHLNDEKIQKYIAQERYSIPITQVVAFSINPVDLRTCKYFNAQRDLVESTPVSLSRKFDFDKAFAIPSCSSPRRKTIDNGYVCVSDQQHCNCPIYEAEQWTVEQEYNSEEQLKSWKLESVRKGIGFKYFRVISIDKESNESTQLFTSNFVEDPQNALVYAEKALYGAVDGIPDVVSVPIDNSQEIKTTYYEYAFADRTIDNKEN